MDPKDFLVPSSELDHDSEGDRLAFRLKVAVTSILCEMAHVDDHFHKSEFAKIIELVDHQFHLMDEEAEQIREISEILIKDKAKVDEAIDAINQHFSQIQKEKICEMAWSVAKADGIIDKYEEFFLNYLQDRLG